MRNFLIRKIKFLCLLGFFFLFSSQTFAAYKITVFLDDGCGEHCPVLETKDFAKTGIGTEEIAEFTIPNYNEANLSQYRYWISDIDGNWDNTTSKVFKFNQNNNTSGSDYISGAAPYPDFKISIWEDNNNSKQNKWPHDFKNVEPVASLVLSADTVVYNTQDMPVDIKFNTTFNDVTTGEYIWYKSTDKATWPEIARTSTPEFTLLDVPTVKTYYKVVRSYTSKPSLKISSNFVLLIPCEGCDADSKTVNIFKENFDEEILPPPASPKILTALEGAGSRIKTPGASASGYEFKDWEYKINEGHYAVVPDPFYCGCGDGANPRLDSCEPSFIKWYRQFRSDEVTPFRDHTINNTTSTGTYGGMLFINFKQTSTNRIAYQRELTAAETTLFVEGAQLRFSAWFAFAALKTSTDAINMDLIIEFKKNGTSTWVPKTTVSTIVEYNDDWIREEATLDLTDVDGDFRILIKNNASGGAFGNDILIDDIQLDICVPSYNAYFHDNGTKKDVETFNNMNDVTDLRVDNKGFDAFGVNPCALVFKVDTIGTPDTYSFYKKITLNAPANTYFNGDGIVNKDLISTVPEKVFLQTVVTTNANCNSQATIDKIEDGTTKPGSDPYQAFSNNFLELNSICGTAAMAITGAPICEDDNLPSLSISSTNYTTDVEFAITSIKNNGADVPYNPTTVAITSSPQVLDLNTVKIDIADWRAGTYTVNGTVTEDYKGNQSCPRNISASFVINPKPVVTQILNPSEITPLCEEETDMTISITASYVGTYQWQEWNPATSAWVDITGATSSTYLTPNNLENGHKYRVKLVSPNSCEIYSDDIIVNVQSCTDLLLTQEISDATPCQDSIVSYKIKFVNNSVVDARNMIITVNTPAELVYEDFDAPVHGSYDSNTNVWTVGTVSTLVKDSLTLYFKVNAAAPTILTNKVYVSKVNADTYTSYDDPTLPPTLKDEDALTVNQTAEKPVPVIVVGTYSYNGCTLSGGTYLYNDLVLTPTDKSGLKWFESNGTEITSASFDLSAEADYSVKVVNTNIPAGYCQSDTTTVNIKINETPVSVTATNYSDCQMVGTKTWASLVTYDAANTLKWYVDNDPASAVIPEPAAFDMNVVQDTAFWVSQVSAAGCESDRVEVRIDIFNNPDAVTITNYSECQTVGTKTWSSLVSYDAFNTLKWYVDNDPATAAIPEPDAFDQNIAQIKSYWVTQATASGCESNERKEVKVEVKAITVTPTINNYNDCAQVGTLDLNNLVVNSASYFKLEWFDVNGTPIADPTNIDKNIVGSTDYFVAATLNAADCASAQTLVTVKIKDYATAANIDAADALICPGKNVTLVATSTLLSPVFKWYKNADFSGGSVNTGSNYDLVNVVSPITYYITVQNADYCENKANDGKAVSIDLKVDIVSVELTPETEDIVLGSGTTKTLTIDPSSASPTVTWTANDKPFDGVFPTKPYLDTQYIVTVTGDCNAVSDTASISVKWPTVFTPYDKNGTNDDFVKDLDEPFSIIIYNRFGQEVFRGPDGWDGTTTDGKIVMPGVYYYIVTLPDGSIKKAPIEVLNK